MCKEVGFHVKKSKYRYSLDGVRGAPSLCVHATGITSNATPALVTPNCYRNHFFVPAAILWKKCYHTLPSLPAAVGNSWTEC